MTTYGLVTCGSFFVFIHLCIYLCAKMCSLPVQVQDMKEYIHICLQNVEKATYAMIR